MSRIGKKPIAIPSGVKVEIKDGTASVEGPKGKLNFAVPFRIKAEVKDGQVVISRASDAKTDKSLHGMSRAMIAGMIKGVTEGYKKELEIIGVGFKAQVQANSLNLALGFSHPVNIQIPEGVKAECPKPTQVVLTGIEKEKLHRFASEIRRIFPPEPYKGKGIRYLGEYVKKKVGKAQATGTK